MVIPHRKFRDAAREAHGGLDAFGARPFHIHVPEENQTGRRGPDVPCGDQVLQRVAVPLHFDRQRRARSPRPAEARTPRRLGAEVGIARDLVARGTIDERVADFLERRRAEAASLIQSHPKCRCHLPDGAETGGHCAAPQCAVRGSCSGGQQHTAERDGVADEEFRHAIRCAVTVDLRRRSDAACRKLHACIDRVSPRTSRIRHQRARHPLALLE